MIKKLEIDKDYDLKGKIVRYIGKGKHTKQLMFRDHFSGQMIFVDEKDAILIHTLTPDQIRRMN